MCNQLCRYRIFILVVTFLSYVCYHMSRKPISVVKPELLKCPNETAVEAFRASQLVAFTSGMIPSTSDLNCTSFIRKLQIELLLLKQVLLSYCTRQQ